MLLCKEIYFHFLTDLIKNLLGPQPETSVARSPGLLVEMAMGMLQFFSSYVVAATGKFRNENFCFCKIKPISWPNNVPGSAKCYKAGGGMAALNTSNVNQNKNTIKEIFSTLVEPNATNPKDEKSMKQ